MSVVPPVTFTTTSPAPTKCGRAALHQVLDLPPTSPDGIVEDERLAFRTGIAGALQRLRNHPLALARTDGETQYRFAGCPHPFDTRARR